MKLHKCPQCNSNNIGASAVLVPDAGFVGYCTCQDCMLSIKSNSDLDRIPEMWESRYKAIKVAKLLWNDIAEHWNNLSFEQSGYIGCKGKIFSEDGLKGGNK